MSDGSEALRHLDLCSGIGGFALAARWIGWETIGFAEIDPFASAVLSKHWPGVPNYGDISNVPAGINADILTAGFPCQPYSVAGKQLGTNDDRAIWPLVIEVVHRVKPRWAVFENVSGFIGMALDGVLSDLAEEGYEAGTVVLPACAVDAPHRRDRVWIVAHSDGCGWNPQSLFGTVGIGGKNNAHIEQSSKAMADADRSGLEGRSGNELCERTSQRPAGTVSSFPNPNREPLGRLAEPWGQRGGGQLKSCVGGDFDGLPSWLDGPIGSGPEFWDGDWERGIPRVATGIPKRAARLKALGNAIVPQVAYQIFRAIAHAKP